MMNDKFTPEIFFEDLFEGLQKTLQHKLTDADLNTFACLTGDFNPVHMDAEYAKKLSLGRPVVHGMLTSSFISTMIGMHLPGPGALWMRQTLNFNSPAYIDDVITITATVKQKSVATRTILLDIRVENQKSVLLVSGEAQVKILTPPKLKVGETMNTQKVALVLGGSSGIGAAVVTKLVQDGHRVAFTYSTSETESMELARSIDPEGKRVFSYRISLENHSEIPNLIEEVEKKLGSITDIVHCAAPNPKPTNFLELDWKEFDKQFQVQIGGIFHTVQTWLKRSAERRGSTVCLIGSIFAEGNPPSHQCAYVAVKSALKGFANSLAVELGPQGIRVNVVAPGMTQTKMLAEIPEKVKMLAKMNTPLRKLGSPEEVAEVVSFLASSKASHIHGETIKVCGGILI